MRSLTRAANPKRSVSRCNCRQRAFLRSLQVCRRGYLQKLSRRYLQRLGEDAALENDLEQRRRSREARLRGLSWSRGRPCGRRRRQNQNIRIRGKVAAGDSARCLTCHGDSHTQSHFARISPLQQRCRLPRLPLAPSRQAEGASASAGANPAVLRMPYCGQADFAKPYHHRVNEGLVQCSDCHNPHGTGPLRQTTNLPSGDAVCFKCHVDKQGPFVYEHMPVKTEGCSSCHTPHGSTNPRLLKVSLVNMLCLQCHTFSDGRGRRRTSAQPVGQVPGLHHVSRPDSWFQFQQCVFQVRSSMESLR